MIISFYRISETNDYREREAVRSRRVQKVLGSYQSDKLQSTSKNSEVHALPATFPISAESTKEGDTSLTDRRWGKRQAINMTRVCLDNACFRSQTFSAYSYLVQFDNAHCHHLASFKLSAK